MCYIVPVRGETSPRSDALELTWLSPTEALSSDIQGEFAGGRENILRQALAHVGVNI
ncbi:DUF4916 domain-containing protein, partial [Escherichia coli]|nr:DUF4916 domain-containing protein [Escherichia coli]